MTRAATSLAALLATLAGGAPVLAQEPPPGTEPAPTEETVEEASLAHEAYLQAPGLRDTVTQRTQGTGFVVGGAF
jgi:hypothetical protein